MREENDEGATMKTRYAKWFIIGGWTLLIIGVMSLIMPFGVKGSQEILATLLWGVFAILSIIYGRQLQARKGVSEK